MEGRREGSEFYVIFALNGGLVLPHIHYNMRHQTFVAHNPLQRIALHCHCNALHTLHPYKHLEESIEGIDKQNTNTRIHIHMKIRPRRRGEKREESESEITLHCITLHAGVLPT